MIQSTSGAQRASTPGRAPRRGPRWAVAIGAAALALAMAAPPATATATRSTTREATVALTSAVDGRLYAQQPPAGRAGGAGRAAGPGPLRSPEVLADRRVTFRLSAPKAAEVRLTCECVKEAVGMTKDAAGIWTATVGPIEPDLYEYEFTVDGVQMSDPRNVVVKYNSRPGPISSILNVPGDGPMFYDLKAVPHGTVDIRIYDSKAAGSARRAFIYTPPGYEKSSNRLPVRGLPSA